MSDSGVVLLARITQAQIELEAMKAANEMRRRSDSQIAYGEDAFMEIVRRLDDAVIRAANDPNFEGIS